MILLSHHRVLFSSPCLPSSLECQYYAFGRIKSVQSFKHGNCLGSHCISKELIITCSFTSSVGKCRGEGTETLMALTTDRGHLSSPCLSNGLLQWDYLHVALSGLQANNVAKLQILNIWALLVHRNATLWHCVAVSVARSYLLTWSYCCIGAKCEVHSS